jgi:PleD family two-component response regulator
MARVADTIRKTVATVGVVAAVYRDGVIVLILPQQLPAAALKLGQALHAAVSALRIANSEAIVTNYATASVSVVAGRVEGGTGRIHLLTRALSVLSEAAAAGGDRVVSECV